MQLNLIASPIARQDERLVAFAGLLESDDAVTRSFTVMTAMPNAEVSELHDRMPVILNEQHWLADFAWRG